MAFTLEELSQASIFELVERDKPRMWVGGNIDPVVFHREARIEGHPEQRLVPVGFVALQRTVQLAPNPNY